MSKDTVTVYWAVHVHGIGFNNDLSQKGFLSVHNQEIKTSAPKSGIRLCPAVKNALQNVYYFESPISDNFKIPLHQVEMINQIPNSQIFFLDTPDSKFPISIPRTRESEDYYNYVYGISWFLFADQPVDLRFSSPYLPPSSPIKNAAVVPGQYNIGLWYRPINLELIAPKNSDVFAINQGDPLAYFEFMTDKKIIFKEYQLTELLLEMSQAGPETTAFTDKIKNLPYRYSLTKKSKFDEKVLFEIKNNVIERK